MDGLQADQDDMLRVKCSPMLPKQLSWQKMWSFLLSIKKALPYKICIFITTPIGHEKFFTIDSMNRFRENMRAFGRDFLGYAIFVDDGLSISFDLKLDHWVFEKHATVNGDSVQGS